MKHAQEIFARADGEVEHASAGAPFVVEEGERIVQVGATEQYEIKFTESDGPSLPVVFKRHSCSELTYVHSVGKDMAMKKGRDQLVRTRRPLSRRRRASSPGMTAVGGFLRDFEWIRTASGAVPARTGESSRRAVLDDVR